MSPLSTQELSKHSKSSLKTLAVDLSMQLTAAEKVIQRLERQVGRLSQELGAQNQQVLLAAESLDRLKRQTYGRSSEKQTPSGDESPLFGEESDKSNEGEPRKGSRRKKRKRNGRTPQPNLPIQDVNHTFTDDDIKAHGLIPWEGQYEESELITVIPSRIVLQRHKRQKYFQTDPKTGEKRIVTAPGPVKLKEGSRYSIEFAVEAGLAKYHWHLPLDRQVKMMASDGLQVTSGTLFELTDTIAWYLRPTVFKGIHNRIRENVVNQADDTTWKNLESEAKRTKDKFYLWAVMNDEAVSFNIYDSRSQKTAKNFLGDLEGVLVSDGHSSFKALASEKLTLANDWYHVRRKFFEAHKNFPEDSQYFLDKIRELSDIESSIQGKPPDTIRKIRQEKSKPIVENIREMIDGLHNVLPQSALGRAIAYTNKLWDGLTVFLNDPRVPMHTNDVERAMRQGAVGRKNHYGSKNLKTARVAAVWYSIVETCKQNGVDPREYLVTTLKQILTKKPYKMPWEWATNPSDLILQPAPSSEA